MAKFVGRVIQWTLAAVLIAALFLVQQVLAIVVAALRGAGDYVWLASGMGTADNSPFGWLREQEALRQQLPAEPRPAAGNRRGRPPEARPALDCGRQGAEPGWPVAAARKAAKSHNKKVGCAVEPGWTVTDVNSSEGHRVEVNDVTDIRRLVHSGTGQVLIADLSSIPTEPVTA
jgi:hypothetical protein